MTAVREMADRLARAIEARQALPPLSDSYPDLDLATGYAVQRLQRDAAGPLIGWKLGVTSRAKQQQVGVHEPIRGYLSAGHALDLGEPLAVDAHIQPRAEPEIALIMRRDLDDPSATAADVLAATEFAAVGIEILDSRYENYRFTMPDVVADNASAGRFVVGSPVTVTGIDLRLVGVVLEHNGEVVGTASGAAALGHPASAVAWLVRSLAADGEGLRAGQVILTGGLTAAVPVSAGDSVVVSIDRVGAVELACC